jgi:copper chaperone NosL
MRGRLPVHPRPSALVLAIALPFAAAACGPGDSEPAALGAQEPCAACRMAVSDARLASQVVAPGELPLFFDDLGCLAGFVKAGRVPREGVVFVADHRTRAWVRADRAIYTRVLGLATPMGSHLVAHDNAASRAQDPAVRDGTPVAMEELFGAALPSRGGLQP